MAITPFTGDTVIIATLADLPNDVGGLTAAQLKAKFDQGPTLLKTYINSTLIPSVEAEIADQLPAPPGSITDAKLSDDPADIKTRFTALQAETVTGLINVKTGFRAVGDRVTDDTIAINNAIAYAATLVAVGRTVTLYFPSTKGYNVSSPIVVSKGISVIMDGQLVYTGSANIIALTVGESGVNNATGYIDHKLNVTRLVQSDWTSENNIGIKLINQVNCRITIPQATGFTIGVQCMGSAYGFVWNMVTLGIVTGKIGVDLTNESSGWCNENIFLNGQFAYFSSASTNGKSRWGVRITSKDASYDGNNNNIFQKPSFELNNTLALPNVSVPILIEYGKYNRFYDIRCESNGTTAATVSGTAIDNLIDVGYTDAVLTVSDTSNTPTTVMLYDLDVMREAKQSLFHSGALHIQACNFSGDQSIINIPKVHFALPSKAGVNNNSITSGTWVKNKNYMEGTNGNSAIGVFVKTENVKRFVIRKDVDTGFGGRIVIVCYDAKGKVLNSTGVNTPYVRSSFASRFTNSGSWEGSYSTNADLDGDLFIKVHDDVKRIRILFTKGTANIRIRSFSIYSLDGLDTAVYTGYEEIIPSVNVATAVPTTIGSFDLGKLIMNNTPATAGFIGWTCTVGGTFGTLSGVTGSITTGTAALTVNDVTNLEIGMYITIAGVTGVKKITAINDLVVTIDSNASATVAAAAVAYSAPVFKTWGVIS